VSNLGSEDSVDKQPRSFADCSDAETQVPVSRIESRGWRRMVEVEKYAMPKGWLVHVPELAIEVWEHSTLSGAMVAPIADRDPAQIEYVIVFRGTVGAGGWFSNLRLLTTALPVFWDQYRQAERSARLIVQQLYALHALRVAEHRRKEGTADTVQLLARPHLVAVGHSLGAALASYVYYKLPQVDRVVGFNPSRFDGASSLSLEERQRVAQRRIKAPQVCTAGGADAAVDAPLRFLTEHGEVLGRFAPCVDGPVWGAEGGPQVKCDFVDVSGGSVFKQHAMNQLACKLSAIAASAAPR
jgi:hypothetical protein